MFDQFKRVFKHSAIYGGGALLGNIASFFLIPVYTRYLGVDEYGVLATARIVASILTIIFGLGIGSALFRFYFDYDDLEDRKAVVSTAFILLVIVSSLLTSLLIITSSLLSPLIFASDKYPLFAKSDYSLFLKLVALAVAFETVLKVPLAVLRAREESKRYTFLSVLKLILSLLLIIYLVAYLRKGVSGVLWGELIAPALLCLFIIPFLFKDIKLTLSLEDLKGMLKFGLPLIPAALASWILTLSDRFFLQRMTDLSEVGLYSLGYQFGRLMAILVSGPFSLTWPTIMFSIAKRDDAPQIYSRLMTYFVLLAGFICLGISLLAKEIIRIMALNPSYWSAYRVVGLIAISYLLYGTVSILSVGVNLKRKTIYYPLIMIIAAISNLILNFILIPEYGMIGAAVATVLSYFIMALMMFLISGRFYYVSYELIRITKIIAVGLAIYIIGLYPLSSSLALSVIYKILLLMLYPLLLYITGFFTAEEKRRGKELVGQLRQSLSGIKLI